MRRVPSPTPHTGEVDRYHHYYRNSTLNKTVTMRGAMKLACCIVFDVAALPFVCTMGQYWWPSILLMVGYIGFYEGAAQTDFVQWMYIKSWTMSQPTALPNPNSSIGHIDRPFISSGEHG